MLGMCYRMIAGAYWDFGEHDTSRKMQWYEAYGEKKSDSYNKNLAKRCKLKEIASLDGDDDFVKDRSVLFIVRFT